VVSTETQVSLPSPDMVTLNVDVIGQGQVTRSVRTALLPRGTVVKLSAVAAEGWVFGGWAAGATGKDAELSVTMDASRTIQATFLSSANLVVNGDFANGVTGWTPSAWSADGAAKGTPTVTDGVLNYAVTNGAAATWNVQLFQTAIPFVKGMTYTLSFDASASKARDVQVYANLGGFNKVVTLGTASKTYSYTFVSDSTESGKLSFDLGGAGTNGTTVMLDNVSIKAVLSGTGIEAKGGKNVGLLQTGRQLILNGEGTLVLCDAKGTVVLRREIRSADRVDLSGLPRGLYFARFQGARSLVRNLD
jgi:hypothetical protein